MNAENVCFWPFFYNSQKMCFWLFIEKISPKITLPIGHFNILKTLPTARFYQRTFKTYSFKKRDKGEKQIRQSRLHLE